MNRQQRRKQEREFIKHTKVEGNNNFNWLGKDWSSEIEDCRSMLNEIKEQGYLIIQVAGRYGKRFEEFEELTPKDIEVYEQYEVELNSIKSLNDLYLLTNGGFNSFKSKHYKHLIEGLVLRYDDNAKIDIDSGQILPRIKTSLTSSRAYSLDNKILRNIWESEMGLPFFNGQSFDDGFASVFIPFLKDFSGEAGKAARNTLSELKLQYKDGFIDTVSGIGLINLNSKGDGGMEIGDIMKATSPQYGVCYGEVRDRREINQDKELLYIPTLEGAFQFVDMETKSILSISTDWENIAYIKYQQMCDKQMRDVEGFMDLEATTLRTFESSRLINRSCC